MQMKILSSFIKRIEILAFIFGFIAGIYMLIFYPAKYFIKWHALPIPPEPAAKIISASHMGDIIITTTSNKKFICDLDHENECWTEINYEPLFFGKVICFIKDCPNDKTKQMVEAVGRLHSFGELSIVYSLHNDGSIYVKQTGMIYASGYLIGAILGGVCAVIAFIGKHLFFRINSLLHKNSD
jgi:hypothetical protein